MKPFDHDLAALRDTAPSFGTAERAELLAKIDSGWSGADILEKEIFPHTAPSARAEMAKIGIPLIEKVTNRALSEDERLAAYYKLMQFTESCRALVAKRKKNFEKTRADILNSLKMLKGEDVNAQARAFSNALVAQQREITEEERAMLLKDMDDYFEMHTPEVQALADKIEPMFLECLKDWHAGYSKPTTPQNLEVLAMNVARAAARIQAHEKAEGYKLQKGFGGVAVNAILNREPRVEKLLDHMLKFYDLLPDEQAVPIENFLNDWLESAYARLEISHKLAASLCLTDVPDDIEVRAPWKAWSLLLPDGLLPSSNDGWTAARIWCVGTEPLFIVTNDARLLARKDHFDEEKFPVMRALRSLIRGACLALSNPNEFKKDVARGSASESSKNLRHGPPELSQARFMLSAPVQVDLREHLRHVLSGSRGGGKLGVQFMVRGHWKNQAHGPRRSLRKHIWIQPFWKGPEESRVLLRQHTVLKEEEAERTEGEDLRTRAARHLYEIVPEKDNS